LELLILLSRKSQAGGQKNVIVILVSSFRRMLGLGKLLKFFLHSIRRVLRFFPTPLNILS
jgi:hypothetical protein